MARDSFLKTAVPLVVLTFMGVYTMTPPNKQTGPEDPAAVTQSASDEWSSDDENAVYYSGCNEVRAAGKAPLYRGDPGYGEHMDGDGDGIACEPYRGQY
jgi:Excalibur calcium-binding domain